MGPQAKALRKEKVLLGKQLPSPVWAGTPESPWSPSKHRGRQEEREQALGVTQAWGCASGSSPPPVRRSHSHTPKPRPSQFSNADSQAPHHKFRLQGRWRSERTRKSYLDA